MQVIAEEAQSSYKCAQSRGPLCRSRVSPVASQDLHRGWRTDFTVLFYREDIVKLVPSNTVEEMENNVETVRQWIAARSVR